VLVPGNKRYISSAVPTKLVFHAHLRKKGNLSNDVGTLTHFMELKKLRIIRNDPAHTTLKKQSNESLVPFFIKPFTLVLRDMPRSFFDFVKCSWSYSYF
jgi:hypothetical protein